MDLGGCKFVVVWEFWVPVGGEERFEAAYGPSGAWGLLFGSDPAYGGTHLIRDEQESRRYLTLDFWASQADYDRFRQAHAAEYHVLDAECGKLTERETKIGRFVNIGAKG